MWLKKEDLLGLFAGLALGGAALYLFLPRIEAALPHPPSPAPTGQPAAPPAIPATIPAAIPPRVSAPQIASATPAAEQPAQPDPVGALPAPAPLPNIAYPDASLQRPSVVAMPAIIGPTQPTKITGTAGTGFFVADDGSLLTAAHVVTECRRTAIASQFVKPTSADIIASDPKHDLALLRTSHVRPPGILPLGHPVSRQLVVFGYPASAGPIIPAETWATLENDKFPASAAALADPREMIWIEAAAVTHGFSGGPILDPGNGSVVGLVRATIDDEHLRLIHGMPPSGVAVGPGAARLSYFLRQQDPYFETVRSSDTGTAAIEEARRAIVHVMCWH